jgi:hypothetical protein
MKRNVWRGRRIGIRRAGGAEVVEPRPRAQLNSRIRRLFSSVVLI